MDKEKLNDCIHLICEVCPKVCNDIETNNCFLNLSMAYKMGYNDAFDKYVPQENEIQKFRRSGHP